MRSKRSWARAAAALLALGLVAAACGDDGGGSAKSPAATGSASGTGTKAAAATTTLAPQKGGSITIGMFSETRGLDPTIGFGYGGRHRDGRVVRHHRRVERRNP